MRLSPIPRRCTGCAGPHQRGYGRKSFLLLTVLVSCAGLLAFELKRRSDLYWYAVDQDYSYDFSAAHSAPLQVEVTTNGVVLPVRPGSSTTGVLALEIRSSATGYWFEPCIAIGPAERAEIQCFERGAKGRRYLVLSHPAAFDDGLLHMRGQHLRWRAGSEPLWMFERESSLDDTVLILAPHPDDAEIAAFGLYSANDSYVVTMTAGNYVDGLYKDLAVSRAAQDSLRGDVRTWDSLVVPSWGGVGPERTVNLGYLTYSLSRFHNAARGVTVEDPADGEPIGRYRQGAVNSLLRDRAARPDWRSVVMDLATVIDVVRPTVIVAPHPMLDAHLDHQYTTIALLEALVPRADERVTLFLYTNHHPLSESYPYGPSEAAIPLPPWIDDGLPIPGVLSFPLDEAARLRKLFALDAMHDLRAPPLRLTGGPATVLSDRIRQGFELIQRDPFGDYSYYRRAVRPTELFLVYESRHLPVLRNYLDKHVAVGDPAD